jgi:hypothetical protein
MQGSLMRPQWLLLWGVFVKEISGVKGLHTLMLCHVQLKEAAAQLSAVTQLTRLALVRCGVGEGVRQELESKLGAACVKVMCDAGWDVELAEGE